MRAVLRPWLPVRLWRHVRQRIDAGLRTERDLVHGRVVRVAALFVKRPAGVEIAVGRTIKLGGVALERMSAELLDVDRHRRGYALCAEGVEAQRAAVRAGQQPQGILTSRL